MEEKVVENVVDNVGSSTNISKSQAFLYTLSTINPKRWLAVGATIAAAIYLHYYTRDDRRYNYVRKVWVRKLAASIWFPREGESFLTKLFENFLKIPENNNAPPPWHYLEVNYNLPDMQQANCGTPTLMYLDGIEIHDDTTYAIMQALRLFGHFDKESLCDIFRDSEIHYLRTGATLFGIGHEDNYIYIVLRGRLDIVLLDTLYLYKSVTEGGQLLSILSLIACVSGEPLVHRGLEAKVAVDTDVVAIPYKTVFEAMRKRPGHLFYTLQRTFERVMGVTLKVMVTLMGLNVELIDERSQKSRYVDFDMEIDTELTDETKSDALQGIMACFDIKQEYLNLLDKCTVSFLENGATLQGEDVDGYNSIIYVHAGEIQAVSPSGMGYFISKGESFGQIMLMANLQSLFSIVVPKKALIVTIPFTTFERIFITNPMTCVKICKQIITRLSWYTLMFGLSLEWKNVQHKTILFKQGEKSHSVYLVLSGRLRSFSKDAEGNENKIGEAGNGDWIGLFEAVTNTDRRKSYIATRDSDLAVIPASLVEYSKIKFPRVTINLLDFVCRRLTLSLPVPKSRDLLERRRTTPSSSIFILPHSADIPMSAFGLEIMKHHILSKCGLVVSSVDAENALKRKLDKEAQYELSAWATRLEALYTLVIYLGDISSPYYNLRCILQADRVLIVANPNTTPPDISELEKKMLLYAPLAKKDLILIYKRDSPIPSGTKEWIKLRPWIIRHHHIRFENEFFNFPGYATNADIRAGYKDLSDPINIHSDMSRLARWLSEKSIALVFGGGGAKGAAFIGFLKTLLSLNFPIDMLAGVSIGSLISAHLDLYDKDMNRLERDLARWFKGMQKWWLYILDSGFTFRSLITGESFNQTLQQMLGGMQIEDMWIPYFCVSTDMTGKCARAHYHGCLSEYVRASMNLAGYFEPYRDPVDGHYLMDGGYIQLVPIDFMRHYGAHYVLAVDISSGKGVSTGGFGDSVSGVEALMNKFLTGSPIPNWYELSAEMTFIQSAFYLQLITKLDAYNIYLKLPTELFTGESFGQYEEIVHWGHRHGKALIKGFDTRSPFPVVWAKLNQFADPLYKIDKRREIYRLDHFKKGKISQYDGDEFDTHKWDAEIFGPMLPH